MVLTKLPDSAPFSRADYLAAIREATGKTSPDALAYVLREDAASGKIIHVGRDKYVFPDGKRRYSHQYSTEANLLAIYVHDDYPDATFQVFELTQLNAFVNHLYAHNTIFLSVENELIDYVFDSLRQKYPGRVMLKPSADMYYKYLVENQIVIQRLPSESPKGTGMPWQSRLEKILVDISADKLLSRIVSPGEFENIYYEAFSRYYLDINMMYRYARRRGALGKTKAILREYVPEMMEG